MVKLIPLALLCLALGPPLPAQENPDVAPPVDSTATDESAPAAGAPMQTLQAAGREGLEWLQPTVGTWTVQTRFTPDDGATWHEATTEAAVTTLLGGRFLHESIVLPFPNGQSMHIECTRSYDNFQKLYRAVCLDNVMALMDVYEGNWDGQKLVLSNLGPNTFFLGQANGALVKIHSRQTLHSFTQDGFQVDWEATADGGKTWSPAGTFTYHHQPEGLPQKSEDETPPQ